MLDYQETSVTIHVVTHDHSSLIQFGRTDMTLLIRVFRRGTARHVTEAATTACFTRSFTRNRMIPASFLTEEQTRQIQEDIEVVKQQDQKHLWEVNREYSSIIEFLQANTTGAPSLQTAVKSASPQSYICTEELEVNRNVDEAMADYNARLEVLQAHVRDLMVEPYKQWDFTIPPPKSKTEMERLDLEASAMREALDRDMAYYKKAVGVIEGVADLYKIGDHNAATKFLKDGMLKIQAEAAGFRDNASTSSLWRGAESDRPQNGGGRPTQEEAEKDSAEDEYEDAEDDWTDHPGLIEEDLGR